MPAKVKSLSTVEYQALQTGLPRYCANTVFTIAGENYTTPQVVAFITTILNVKLAVAPAKATWLAAIAAIDAAEAENAETVKAVREVCAVMFKNAPATLSELAIQPRKSPRPLTAPERVAANAKAAATRLARGTTGKRQKAKVTGNVTGVTITNVTSTPPATTATAPAGTSAAPTASAGGSTPHA